MNGHKKRLLFALLLVLLTIPVVIWLQQTGSLMVYLDGSAPPGQLPYVLSKLTGMMALTCIAGQIIITLASQLHITSTRWLGLSHRITGGAILLLVMTHYLSFFIAVTLRQETLALSLLFPNFSDFYHTHLTLGLFGLWLLCLVAFIGWLRSRKRPPWTERWHRLYWVVLGLVYFHALAVGSESQSLFGIVFYTILGLMIISLSGWKAAKHWAPKVTIS